MVDLANGSFGSVLGWINFGSSDIWVNKIQFSLSSRLDYSQSGLINVSFYKLVLQRKATLEENVRGGGSI